jgi:lipopolysaccharide export system permease protein
MNALLYDVRQQKPALMIKEGVFYNGIDGYSIRIGKKDSDGKTIREVMIYDHSESRGNAKLIMAEKGKMAMSDDERYLLLTLFNGSSYEEREDKPGRRSRPFMRTEFLEQQVKFDLSSFKMTRTNEQLFKDNYQMLNLGQLTYASDSIKKKLTDKKVEFYSTMLNTLMIDSVKLGKPKKTGFTQPKFIENFPQDRKRILISSASYAARNVKNITDDTVMEIEIRSKSLAKHQIEWQRKFTLSFACLILFFIGAPLGAIIRKGGLGMPVVVSIIFFVIYHVISISGEKFAREGVIPPWKGMWISSVVLLPIGIFLSYKAATDSALFDKESYRKFFRKILKNKR